MSTSKPHLGEVRQRPALEAVRDALALDVLLPHAREDLRDVDEGPLGPGVGHCLHGVPLVQTHLGRGTGLVTGRVEHLLLLQQQIQRDGNKGCESRVESTIFIVATVTATNETKREV